jgi:16S rRNA G966 N2-methylase RsmD
MAGDLVALDGWARWLSDDGFLIVERESVGEIPPAPGLELIKQRDYGRSRILIYRRAS